MKQVRRSPIWTTSSKKHFEFIPLLQCRMCILICSIALCLLTIAIYHVAPTVCALEPLPLVMAPPSPREHKFSFLSKHFIMIPNTGRNQRNLIQIGGYGTSNSGPSKIGTVYNRPLYKGRCLRSQVVTLPIVLIHLQPIYKGQKK